MRGAIVLAGGPSRRMGRPKPFVRVGGVPLLLRVVKAASGAADEVVVVSRVSRVADLVTVVPPGVAVVRDRDRRRTPLVGLRAGSAALRSGYVAALPCDLPFLRSRVLERLFAEAEGRDAAIPVWPDGRLEPLVAVYRRRALSAAVDAALAADERSNLEMVDRLRRPRFVPVAGLRAADPFLQSFENINTAEDLARARRGPGSRRGASPRTR